MNEKHSINKENRRRKRYAERISKWEDLKHASWVKALEDIGITNVDEFCNCMGEDEILIYWESHTTVDQSWYLWEFVFNETFEKGNPQPVY